MLKQRALLKSIISYLDDKKELKNLLENFELLSKSNVYFSVDIHNKVYSHIKEHVLSYTEVASNDLLKKHFENDSEISEELDKIEKEKPLFGSNFKSLSLEVYNDQQKQELTKLLQDVSKISESGLKIKKDYIKGPREAAQFFLHNCAGILKSESEIKTEGTLKGDSSEILDRYFKVKRENIFRGILTGLDSLDLSCRGMRPGELWLLMAYVGELKTTLAMNFAYTQAIELKKNVKFLTLEMTYEQCQNIFCCIHSANFTLWAGGTWDDAWPITYDDILEGTLTARQEEFLEFLIYDLNNNPEYGYLDIYQPKEALTISTLMSYAEIEHKKRPIDVIYLDYIELMKDAPGVNMSKDNYTINLNNRIRDLKQFALHFNGGEGIRLISAYQANREGKKLADKNDGVYRLDALSYANEAERSADVILYAYLNEELRANKEVKIGCLKNRTKAHFKQFVAKTRLECRKVYEPVLSDAERKAVSDTLTNKSAKKTDINSLI